MNKVKPDILHISGNKKTKMRSSDQLTERQLEQGNSVTIIWIVDDMLFEILYKSGKETTMYRKLNLPITKITKNST